MFTNKYVADVFNNFCLKNKGQEEYIQACQEILESLQLMIDKNPSLEKQKILERFLEPERVVTFRVCWLDDNNEIQVNKGYRIQYNSSIGPYKGGLRFHPSVNESIMKFLALEQCLKNSLTTLPIGGAKGGSDFDPKGKSDNEIMRFCQSFMTELYRHIGANLDVPAGDIGVGQREIGYLFGQYKRIVNEYSGALTGKAIPFGGSLVRKEATGYGLCYFTNKALNVLKNDSIKDKIIAVSGAGNVAIYTAKKAIELGGKVVTMSDSSGWVYDENGIDLDVMIQVKEVERLRIVEYAKRVKSAKYFANDGTNPSLWSVKCDIAMPCATQNELTLNDAKMLVKNNVIAVCEGANMPTTLDAVHYLIDNGVIYGPGKASNAGGVATSALEMSQNSMRLSWTFDEVDAKLKNIMENIFTNIYVTSKKYGIKENDLITGANIAGFEKIAEAMIIQGVI